MYLTCLWHAYLLIADFERGFRCKASKPAPHGSPRCNLLPVARVQQVLSTASGLEKGEGNAAISVKGRIL